MLTPCRPGFAVSLLLAAVVAVAPISPAATGEPSETRTTPSTPTAPPADLKMGDWVGPMSGGPTMRIQAINGDTSHLQRQARRVDRRIPESRSSRSSQAAGERHHPYWSRHAIVPVPGRWS
jgi:hypothetical protein